MKALFTSAVLALLIATATNVRAQDWQEDYLGLPGDNLNLYAAMKLFQESETLEGFEMALNSEDTGINNLDLNGDRRVDYINVTDHIDGNVHNIVLSVALNKKHRQDVAVFVVERFRDGSAQIQLVGDEALYGRNYIVEPYYDNNTAETANPGYYGRPVSNVKVTVVTTSAWQVASWPLVHYIYLPGYMAWHSPWYWGYWPASWSAWDPWYYHYYYGYHSYWNNHYTAHFRHWNHVRYHGYNDFYYAGVRHYSKDVHTNINKGYYKDTYSHPELQKEGRALHARVATESNRTRVTAGSREASATRLSSAVPESARVRATATTAARRTEGTVETRTRSEATATRGEAGVTSKSATRSEAVETRRSAPATGSTTYTRPAATTRTSSEVTSGTKGRTEMTPRTTTTARPAATTSGTTRSTGVSTRSSSSPSTGSVKVATRPASSGSSSSAGRSSSTVSSSRGSSSSTGSSASSSSTVSSSRGSSSAGDSAPGRTRR